MENNIKELIDKYFEANTTIKEEEMIRSYFRQDAIDASLEPYRAYFAYVNAEREVASTQKLSASDLVNELPQRRRLSIVYRQLARVAAIAGLLVASWFVYQDLNETSHEIVWEQYAPEDDEEALAVAKAALIFASSKLNGGADKAAGEVLKFKKVTKFFKHKHSK